MGTGHRKRNNLGECWGGGGVSIIRQIPNAADGGYWYVTQPVEIEEEGEGGKTAPIDAPWCAWYATLSGTDYVVVRRPDPLAVPPDEEAVSVSDVLAAVGLSIPLGRVEGK